ncbi:hypothetical protein K4K61_008570 [Colletotrichum sp. SAR11_59]|nr:hypothetical protein K4K61_008570 [Colletotrichum sp. SAR11_59]
MLWYSQQHDGIAKTRQDDGYVWRFGPTAVLTIVAAFWARVELQAMRYMPWIALRRGQSPDYDLDYTSMLMPTVLYASLRRKHWLVLLVSVVSLLIRAEIVLAPGLFQLTPVQRAEPASIAMADSFSLTWNTDTGREAIIAYYAARAVHDFNMTYPFGVTQEAAYQTFALADTGRRGTTSAPVKAEVDAFFTGMECLKAKRWSASEAKKSISRFYSVDVSFHFEGCQQNVSFTQETVQMPDTSIMPAKIYDSWQLSKDPSPNSRPCANLPQQYYQFVYFAGQYVKGASVNSSRPVELVKAGAILCSPTAWISKVEVTDDGISPNLTVLPNQEKRPIEADIWGILGKAIPTTPGGWDFSPQIGTSQLNYGPVRGELSFSEKRANFSDTTELLYNCTISLTRRLGPLVGHYLFRQNNTDKSEAVADMFVVIDRLALNPQVCWAIFALSALIAAIIGLSLFRSRRYTTIWHRDPATVLGHLLFLSDHPELRETEPNESDDKSWSHGTFTPIVLRPWAQIAFAIFVCGLLIGLVPAAKLVSSCQRLPEARFNISVMNYTDQISQNTSETVYQGPMLIKEKCPTGYTDNLGHLFIFGRNQTGAHSGRSSFADILASPGNLYDMNLPCQLNITDANDLLRPTMQQTYVWGQWNYDKYDFDLLRFWRCDYSWAQVMTDVTMVKGSDGGFSIDQTRPPVPDLSTTKKLDHPFVVPVRDYKDLLMVAGASTGLDGDVAPEIIVTDPSAGDINPFFRPLIQPYGKLPLEAFGDPEWENAVLEELHTNLGFASAQLANLENRLGVGQDSRTSPFPAEGLPAVKALVTDGGQRRLMQNATVTRKESQPPISMRC